MMSSWTLGRMPNEVPPQWAQGLGVNADIAR
jgi:hypothetical protein